MGGGLLMPRLEPIDSLSWCSHFFSLILSVCVFFHCAFFLLAKAVSTINKHPFKDEQMLGLGFSKSTGGLDMLV